MRRPWITLLLGAFVALGLAACGGASAASDVEVPPPTIGLGSDVGDGRISGGADVRRIDTGSVEQAVMIGDSITVAATPALEEQFAGLGLPVVITAQQAKRIDSGSSRNASGTSIAEFVAADLDGDSDETLWIVALGTNDIGQYSSGEEIDDVVDALLEPIPDDAPLIWIDTYIVDRPEQTDAVNAAIVRALTDRGNAVVGPWSEIAQIDGVLRSDGVHPSSDGAIFFATVVTNTVAEFIG